MKKKTLLGFCMDYIKNDDQLMKIADDPVMLITLSIVASECIEAYQKALIDGVEFEAAKHQEE